jgi:phosphohistidine phosphatase
MARFLKPLRLRLGAIWHSDRVRAIQTAGLLSPAVVVKKRVELKDIGPDDRIGPLHRRLRKVRGDLMIVGHLPFLDKLLARLIAGSSAATLVNFTTSSIVALADDEGDWRIQWMMSPEALANAHPLRRGRKVARRQVAESSAAPIVNISPR